MLFVDEENIEIVRYEAVVSDVLAFLIMMSFV